MKLKLLNLQKKYILKKNIYFRWLLWLNQHEGLRRRGKGLVVATIFSGSGAPKRNRNIFVGPVGFGWRIRLRFRAMERAGEEAPLPGDLPTLFTRRRTVTFNGDGPWRSMRAPGRLHRGLWVRLPWPLTRGLRQERRIARSQKVTFFENTSGLRWLRRWITPTRSAGPGGRTGRKRAARTLMDGELRQGPP